MNLQPWITLVALSLWLAGCGGTESPAPPAEPPAARPLYYRHPMDPAITAPEPRKDEMGMDYIPVYAEVPAPAGGTVTLSPALVNNLGVRTAPVRHGPAAVALRAAGTLRFDERSLTEVRVRAPGWVERLHVRATGERVRRGAALLAVYAPALAAAQREFVAARAAGDAVLLTAARERLLALGLAGSVIERLAAGAEPVRQVVYRAPRDGVVAALAVRAGGMVEPGVAAVVIAADDPLWVVAAIPERQAVLVGPGTMAGVRVAALPGEEFEARVLELLPELDPATRTVPARLRLANPTGQFAAGMLAEVTFAAVGEGHALFVPQEAVIRTGGGARVLVALGGGRFAPRPVVAGHESGDEVEITDGLDGTEQVVVSGQFMLDSESRARAALGRYAEPDAAVVPASPPAADPHAGHGSGP